MTSTNLISSITSKLFARPKLKAKIKQRRKNSDWSRVDEPDFAVRSVEIGLHGVVLTSLFMMGAYAFMTGQVEMFIAEFLHQFDGDFQSLYASFTASVIALSNLTVITFFIMFAHSDGNDIVDIVSDHDANAMERIAELEETLVRELENVKAELKDDLHLTTTDDNAETEERLTALQR